MAEQQLSLGDILSDAPPPEPVVEAPKEPVEAPVVEAQKQERPASRKVAHRDKEQEAQGRVRDPETGQYAPKAEEPKAEEAKPAPEAPKHEAKPAAPQHEFTEKELAFLRAAQDERTKRQTLERENAELRAKVAPAASTEAPKTFWDDPQGHLDAHTAQVKTETLNARLGMAEFTARQKYPDFSEKAAKFGEILQQNPGLRDQWLSSPDPAEYAYKLAKNHMDLQQVGGLEEMRAKIERETTARVRAEVEAELKAKSESLAKDRAALPPSLSDARSVGGNANRPVWNGPESLEQILKG